MAPTEKRVYQFGPFRIDSVEKLLYRGGELVPLTPKVVDTLLALVSNSGRVVEKEELLRTIWPDSYVEEGGLARNVSILRKVFEAADGGAGFIETIPKRGYRFVAQPTAAPPPEPLAPIELAPANPPATPEPDRKPRWEWIGPAILLLAVLAFGYFRVQRTPTIHSLVVLPLQDLSNDAVLAEGMQAEINSAVATIGALKVIGETTAMTYRGSNKRLSAIGAELGVEGAIEGTIQRQGDRVAINIQMVETKTERTIWAKSWDRNLADVLSLEREIATTVADQCRMKLTATEIDTLARSRTMDSEAVRDYWRGRYYWNKRTPEGIQTAIDYFRKAIDRDPGYAIPWAGWADALAQMGTNGADVVPPRSVMPKAKAAAQQAVALDDRLAEAHTSLGNIKMAFDWDLEGAHREFQRAVELNPGYATAHHWYAHYWLAVGRTDKALEEIQLALDRDPLSLVINVGMGFVLYHTGKFDEAIEQFRSTVAMDPNFPLAHATLGMALQARKLYPQAIDEFTKALSGSPGLAMAGLGSTYAAWGRPQDAQKVLAQMEELAKSRYVPAMYRSVVYASIGDKDRAVEWARTAFEERSDYMIHLRTEPWASAMRSDPRFQEILQKVARGGR